MCFFPLQSMAHHNFRRASDTLLLKTNQDEAVGRNPHRQRSQLIPDVTIQAATIAKKIGKGELELHHITFKPKSTIKGCFFLHGSTLSIQFQTL